MKIFVILALLIALNLHAADAQTDRMPASYTNDLPHFYLDLLNFRSDSGKFARLDAYIQVPYQMISFGKRDNLFTASYEISISIYDDDEALVKEKNWTENIETGDYKESVSPITGRISQRSFYLHPDEYRVVVLVRDLDTKRAERIERKLRIKDFDSVSMSDMMIVNKRTDDSERIIVVPNVSASVADLVENIPILFEAYAKQTPINVAFFLSVENSSGIVVRFDTLRKQLLRNEESCFMNVSCKNLPAGRYIVKVKELLNGAVSSNEKILDSIAHSLVVRIQGLPTSVANLDLAIDQLQYIAEKDEIEEMKKAAPEKKKEMFQAFWQKRDPTKDTDVNELMEEYYGRVEYANRNFSHYVDGWKTDRGNVYILFGEPSNVERHPFEVDSKPYEIWTYYELNREFVFVDDSGFGDYRLRNPIWDGGRNRYR